jgi:hypothetical protein
MSDRECILLYERATGESIDGLDDPEIHAICDDVRRVRKAQSEEEAISAVLYWGHDEDWTRVAVKELRK